MKTLNAVVMVIFVRVAVGYIYAHLVVAKLTALMDQFVRTLDGW